MRKLAYSMDLAHLRQIKNDIVPALFTSHQFDLIIKKFSGKEMTPSEKNEFSRTISKKMKGILQLVNKQSNGIFIYGKERMIPERLQQASIYLKRFSRQFKNKHIILTGSFLYSKSYNDIDIFIVSKYEKEERSEGKFHINHLTEDVYTSLFFKSITKLCISNREIIKYPIKEEASLDNFISLYQELFNDLDKNFKGIRSTLREFLLQASFIANATVPDSLDLRNEANSIINLKNPKEIIKNIFINAVLIGVRKEKALSAMKQMLVSYQEVIKEYKQHAPYYLEVMDAFKRVISLES